MNKTGEQCLKMYKSNKSINYEPTAPDAANLHR